jgi:hypothetical protein
MYSIDYSSSMTPQSCGHNSCTCTCGHDREGLGSQKGILDIGKNMAPLRPIRKSKYLKNFKTDLTKSTLVAAALQKSRPDVLPPEMIDLKKENDVTFDLGNMIAKFLTPQKTEDELIVNTFKNIKIDFQNGGNKAYLTGLPDFFYEKTTGKIPEIIEIPAQYSNSSLRRYYFRLPGSHLKKNLFDNIDLSQVFKGDSFQLNTKIKLDTEKGKFQIFFRLNKLYRYKGNTMMTDTKNNIMLNVKINNDSDDDEKEGYFDVVDFYDSDDDEKEGYFEVKMVVRGFDDLFNE